MPTRLERREGEGLTIGGVTVYVGFARGGCCTLFVEGYDDCGLFEGAEAVKAAAQRFARRLDDSKKIGKDKGEPQVGE